MKNFFQKQFEEEKAAAIRIGGFYLKILIIFWGIAGIVMLATPAWFLGLIFIGASSYILFRTKSAKNKFTATMESQKKPQNTFNDTIYCPKCGTKQIEEANFCINCGCGLTNL